ncbi:MAG: EAL domain-containing protein [Bacilli bacterium]|nr:EAL domain-containing protein [Bacilli bacterium]
MPVDGLFAANTFYMLFRVMIPLMLFFYSLIIAKIYYPLKRKKGLISLLTVPGLVMLVLLIANIWNHWIFYYEVGAYHREPLALILYFIAYAYAFSAVMIILFNRKLFDMSKFITVILALLLQIAASVVQFFLGFILVEMLATALSLLILSVFIENPENFIDYRTQLPSFNSFISLMDRKLGLKEEFGIVFVHTLNHTSLYNMYGHRQVTTFLRSFLNRVNETIRRVDKSGILYYLDQGTFAIVHDDKEKDNDLRELLNERFNSLIKADTVNFHFISRLTLVDCPEDFSDIESLVAFSTTFSDLTNELYLDITPYRSEKGNLLFALDNVLEKAIAEKSFDVYYQPVYDTRRKRFTSAEALLRLANGTFGMIFPGLMVPYAEKRGKIAKIGDIVMEKSFAFISNSLKYNLDFLEINLSSLQLLDPTLITRVLFLASQYDVSPSKIVFEITESVEVMDNPVAIENIVSLHKVGFRIAIDDFGTGYSNIARIINLPATIIKFDKSLTDILIGDKQDATFQNLFDMLHAGGKEILLEGVESKELADKVIKMGVDFIQGFYYCHPMPEEELVEFFVEKK